MRWFERRQEVSQEKLGDFCLEWARLIDFGDRPTVALQQLAKRTEDKGLGRALSLVLSDLDRTLDRVLREIGSREEVDLSQVSMVRPQDGILKDGLTSLLSLTDPDMVLPDNYELPEVNPLDEVEKHQDLFLLQAFQRRRALFGDKFIELLCVTNENQSSPFQNHEFLFSSKRRGIAGYLESVGNLLLMDSKATPEERRDVDLRLFSFSLGARCSVGVPFLKALPPCKKVVGPEYGGVVDDLIRRFTEDHYGFEGHLAAHPEFFPPDFVALAYQGACEGELDSRLLEYSIRGL